jgi:hypothetical protein
LAARGRLVARWSRRSERDTDRRWLAGTATRGEHQDGESGKAAAHTGI